MARKFHFVSLPGASLRHRIFAVALGGFAAGLLNGLLGAGGGIAAVSALSFALSRDEESKKSIYANALVLMFTLSVITLVGYFREGKTPESFMSEEYAPILLAASLGGMLGALLTDKLRSAALKKIFSALTVLSGFMLVLR